MPTHREFSLDTGTSRGSAWAVLAALFVPFAGFVLGVVYLLRERIGKGLALILLRFVCFGAWAVVGSVALVTGANHALHEFKVQEIKRRNHPVSVRIGGETPGSLRVGPRGKGPAVRSEVRRASDQRALRHVEALRTRR